MKFIKGFLMYFVFPFITVFWVWIKKRWNLVGRLLFTLWAAFTLIFAIAVATAQPNTMKSPFVVAASSPPKQTSSQTTPSKTEPAKQTTSTSSSKTAQSTTKTNATKPTSTKSSTHTISTSDVIATDKTYFNKLEVEISKLSQNPTDHANASVWVKWSANWNQSRQAYYNQVKNIDSVNAYARLALADEFTLWQAYNSYFQGIGDKTTDQQNIVTATNTVLDDLKQSQSDGSQ